MTTSYSLTEDVPLNEEKEGTNSIQFRATKGNVTLSKAKVFAVVVFVIVLLVLVIVLGAILGHVLAVRKGREVHHATTVPPTSPVPTTPGTEAWWQIRLPDDVIPIHYNVLLNITVKQPRFDGRVEILVNVTKPTRLILVHSWDKTNITMATVTGTGTARHIPIKNSFFFNKNEFFVMEMESLLEQGQFLVKLEFEAFFSIQPYGLYRKTYKTPKGNESPYAATQFEASQARKAFPCFDEPALKATFNITIAHSPEYIALSNMPIYKSERTRNQVHDHYMTTVVMPTYLLAFVVGDFKYQEMTSKYGIKMRYYSRPAAINNTDYALSVGGKIMTFFEEHLGVNYSLPKEDQVAIPYFGPGAMENWGLILYAEPFLLWNPETDTEQSKQLVTAVVTHELGHQWFGNILTLKWWSDIWLNEGFAKFFEYTAKVAGEPIWKEHDDIISSAMSKAMTYDGDVTSNPIRVAMDHQNGMNTMSAVTYYDKAACVLRMLEDFLGKDIFLAGLKRYLATHAFANAETDDLWKALTTETCTRGSCIAVKEIMDPWVLQMGYPVVTMKRENGTHYRLTQSRFLFKQSSNSTEEDKYRWNIPFTHVTSGHPRRQFKMLNKSVISSTIKWDGNGWIKANYDYKGFYIVNYDDANWDALARQLKTNHTVFSAADRAGLLLDAFNLARAGRLNYTKVLGITSYLDKETEYVPWKIVTDKMEDFRKVMPAHSTIYRKVQQYLVHQTKGQYNRLGFQDIGNTVDKFERGDVLAIQCRAEVESCVQNATTRFSNWVKDPKGNFVPPNFRSLVFHEGVRGGGVEVWDHVFQQYQKSDSKTTRRQLLYGLAGTQQAWLLSKYLSYTLDTKKIRNDDVGRVFYYVSNYNPIGRRMAWDFVRINWASITARYGGLPWSAYKSVIKTIASGFTTRFQLVELTVFHSKISGIPLSTKNDVIKVVQENIAWKDHSEKDINNWLTEYMRANNIK